MAWSIYEAAAQDIAERGVLVPGRSTADAVSGTMVKNPSVQVARDASVALLRWCKELGFTPDSRLHFDVKELTGDRHLGPERFFSGLE